MTSAQIAALVLVAAACIPDLRTRRIPNALTFGGAAAALAFHSLEGGWTAAAWSVGGWAAGLALFLPMFLLRGMGAGDVKLLAAIGAWLGPGQVVWVALLTSVTGGVLALVVGLAGGYLRTAGANIYALLMHWRVMGLRPLDRVTLAGSRGPRLAYAVPIAIGTLLTVLLK
jgi:prepilin peptidase CpaA